MCIRDRKSVLHIEYKLYADFLLITIFAEMVASILLWRGIVIAQEWQLFGEGGRNVSLHRFLDLGNVDFYNRAIEILFGKTKMNAIV